jgi:hypothetical protein
MSVCVVSEDKMQDNQDKETSTDEVQSIKEYKENQEEARFSAPVQGGPGACDHTQ